MSNTIHIGSNLDVLPTLPDNSVDSIVTDPPYELGFMGKSWDSTGIAYNVTLWRECFRVLKPGGHLLAFSGSRTYHRMTCAIEDAGFEVRDQIMWVYGSGFPKSHNISKAFDKDAGAEREVIGEKGGRYATPKQDFRGGKLHSASGVGSAVFNEITAPATDEAKQWDGWGTALKPAHEPICVARKPLDGTVVDNVRKWGVGGLNIDGCRVGTEDTTTRKNSSSSSYMTGNIGEVQPVGDYYQTGSNKGRFPANLIHDGSQQVLDLFPGDKDKSSARFFYCPKASKADRDDGCEGFEEKELKAYSDFSGTPEHSKKENVQRRNIHPTVKPTELMAYLCRLVTPPGGTILDPFTGSGSTGRAAVSQCFNFIGIELSPEYAAIAEARIKAANP